MWPHREVHEMLWGAAAVLWTVAALAALAAPETRRAVGRTVQRAPGASCGRALALLIPALGLTWLGARAHFLLTRDPAGWTTVLRDLVHLVGGGTRPPADVGIATPPAGLHIGGGLLLAVVWLVVVGPRLLGRGHAGSRPAGATGESHYGIQGLETIVEAWTASEILDRVMPPAGWAIALGRLGCFADGCCFGAIATWPWCIRYPVGSPPQLNHLARELLEGPHSLSLPIHPLPIYLALGAVLAGVAARAVAVDAPAGARAARFVLVLATARLLAEHTREAHWAPPVPGTTWLSASAMFLALGVVVVLAMRSPRPSDTCRQRLRPQSVPVPNQARCNSANEP